MSEPLAGPLDAEFLATARRTVEQYNEARKKRADPYGIAIDCRDELAEMVEPLLDALNSTSSAAPAEAVATTYRYAATPVHTASGITSTPEAAPVVRGLEWVKRSGGWYADRYFIWIASGYFIVSGWDRGTNPYETLDAAKAAAQADYERRMEVEREASRVKADMAELRRICTARIEELEATSIPLTKAEIQSGHNRVQWAENLIRQLPTGHNGRDSWLLNFGTKEGDGQ